ncbi:MAG: hypothetical protein JO141_16040 [Bradyrhizobium sp.]|nr:hypothetical protein [Bradyrhizobium sp.]
MTRRANQGHFDIIGKTIRPAPRFGSGLSHLWGVDCKSGFVLPKLVRRIFSKFDSSGKLLIWDKVLGLGTTDALAGWASGTANLVVSFYFAKRGFENVARIIKR